MRRSALVLLLLSCVDKETEDTGPAAESCPTTLLGADPAANSNAAPLAAKPSVTLSASDSSANLLLTTAEGAMVEGLFAQDGDTLTFTPTAPLAVATAYTAVATWCEGAARAVIPFTTTAGDLVGNTYRIPLPTITADGGGSLFTILLFTEPKDLLLQVTAQTSRQLDLVIAPTTTTLGIQDECLASQELKGADFTADPHFVTLPQDYSLSSSETNVPFSSMVIDATVMPGGGGLHKLRISGDLDARLAAPFLAVTLGTSDPNELCGLLAGFGASCQACVSDGLDFCIPLRTEEASAVPEADTTVDCVRLESCHPRCPTNTCDDPSVGLCD